MAAPLAVAGPAISSAGQAVTGIVKVLSTDIVKLEGRIFRRVRLKQPRTDKAGRLLFTKKGRMRMQTVEIYEPVDVSVHANPIGLGVLAVGATLAAIGLFGTIDIAGPFGPIRLYRGIFADEFDAWKGKRSDAAEAGLPLPGLTDIIRPVTERPVSCLALRTAYLLQDNKAEILAFAKAQGCAWAQGL